MIRSLILASLLWTASQGIQDVNNFVPRSKKGDRILPVGEFPGSTEPPIYAIVDHFTVGAPIPVFNPEGDGHPTLRPNEDKLNHSESNLDVVNDDDEEITDENLEFIIGQYINAADPISFIKPDLQECLYRAHGYSKLNG